MLRILRASVASLPGGKSYSEWLTQLNAAYGFDKGIVEGYFSNWLFSTLKGDFGDSWFFNVPVVQKFNTVIWNSFILGVLSFVLEIVIAVPLGILAARKQYSRSGLCRHDLRAHRHFAADLLLCHPPQAASCPSSSAGSTCTVR